VAQRDFVNPWPRITATVPNHLTKRSYRRSRFHATTTARTAVDLAHVAHVDGINGVRIWICQIRPDVADGRNSP